MSKISNATISELRPTSRLLFRRKNLVWFCYSINQDKFNLYNKTQLIRAHFDCLSGGLKNH